MSARPRLRAEERRAAVLDTACRVFARCSYRGATTAEIAREAGVTEPILYRHFASKQALYLACIESAWSRVRAGWDEAVAAEPDPTAWTRAMSTAFLDFKEQRSAVAQLWLRALTESGDDPEIRRYLRRHLRDVHGFVADVVRRAQAAGAIHPDRDSRAEAWIFVSLGLLNAVAGRLGALPPGDLERIRAARHAWLTSA
ncbi:MAG: TetR/AcrR family transcriptional regulator [Verrucomicrobiota bacterium]